MSEELQDVTPTGAEQAEQVQEVETQQGSEATAEQAAEQQTEQQQDDGTQKKEPWFQKRIGELTREKYEARRSADDLKQENERLRQALASGGQHGDGQPNNQDIDSLVKTEAQKLVESQDFDRAVGKVLEVGKGEFKESFPTSIRNLTMVGMNDDFIRLALDTDAPHKVIHHLGQEENLDEAARIMSLPPTKQARELFKLEQKLAQPAVKPVSKAPAPITPLGSGKAASEGLSDDLPIDEWMRRHNTRK